MSNTLKPRSPVITDGLERAAARTMLMFDNDGLSPEDLDKLIIGVANTWIEIGPCNFHLRRLAAKVKAGIRDATSMLNSPTLKSKHGLRSGLHLNHAMHVVSANGDTCEAWLTEDHTLYDRFMPQRRTAQRSVL